MSVGKILFFSLSSRSTGEISYLIGALNGKYRPGIELELIVHRSLSKVAGQFPGQITYHDFLTKDRFEDILNYLARISEHVDALVLIDVNSLCLEFNLTDKNREELIKFLEVASRDKKVAIIDYFCATVSDYQTYQSRKELVERKVYEITRDLPGKPFEMYYFTKFLKMRALSQILYLPSSVQILRPLPVTLKVTLQPESNITYYKNTFWKVEQGKPDSKKFLITFSRFFSNRVIRPKFLERLFIEVSRKIIQTADINEIVFIDPIGVVPEKFQLDDVRVTTYKWLERKAFLAVLAEAAFTAAFVPYATIGTISILNRIPFVSLYSSRFSSEIPWMRQALDSMVIPPFNGFGIWEDISFYDVLTENNLYFNTLIMADIGDDKSFITAIQSIRSQEHIKRIESFLKMYPMDNLPFLVDAL